MHADYLTVAVRTSPDKLSMIIVDANMKGITKKALNTSGGDIVAYIIFEDVEVPESHIIGTKGNGFMQIMYNFNPERLGLVIQTLAYTRRA